MTTPEPCAGTFGPGPKSVESPGSPEPYRFGALTAFSFIEDPDDHEQNGIVYKSLTCLGEIEEWEDNCDSSEVLAKTPTDGDPFEPYVQGCPFHLYSALSCRMTNLEDMYSQVAEVFRLKESFAVERAVWNRIVAVPEAVVLNATSDVEDAMNVVAAVGALESAMGACYPGIPTLHSDRAVAAFAAQNLILQAQAGVASTPLGSKWAFYSGGLNTGPDGTPAPDGYAWLYATSQVTVRRWATQVPRTVFILRREVDGDGLPVPQGGQTNEPYVLAERTYVPSRECCSYAVLVCLPQECGA